MKTISVLTPCFNEEQNAELIYNAIREQFEKLPQYRYEHIFIDNASTDRTVEILRRLSEKDEHVRVIVNSRNFGPVRSPYYGLLQCRGDAVIALASDLQDPPELIPTFLERWEAGFKLVLGVKASSAESRPMSLVRSSFYRLLRRLSPDVEQIDGFYGFGLYDKTAIDIMRQFRDPYPYLRGVVSELGFARALVPFTQPRRQHGTSRLSWYELYDVAALGFVHYSKIPLRLAIFAGAMMAVLSMAIGLFYLGYKVFFWDRFQLGVAPLVIAFFFFSAVQLIFVGVLGEYVAGTFTYVRRRPLVIEDQRINFPHARTVAGTHARASDRAERYPEDGS